MRSTAPSCFPTWKPDLRGAASAPYSRQTPVRPPGPPATVWRTGPGSSPPPRHPRRDHPRIRSRSRRTTEFMHPTGAEERVTHQTSRERAGGRSARWRSGARLRPEPPCTLRLGGCVFVGAVETGPDAESGRRGRRRLRRTGKRGLEDRARHLREELEAARRRSFDLSAGHPALVLDGDERP